MEYKFKISPLGNVYRRARPSGGQYVHGEEYNFKKRAWEYSWVAEDAFYDSTDSFTVTKEEAEEHIADILKQL